LRPASDNPQFMRPVIAKH